MSAPAGVDVWGDVVGQEAAVGQLSAAAANPVHAYLVLGPPGAGKRAIARGFAALLLCDGASSADAERHVRLALAEQHPDLRVVEPQGATLRREEAEQLVANAARSPVEGRRKVVMGLGLEAAEEPAVGLLLKTIEEPPASTVFLLLARELTPELATIASRCNLVELSPVPEAAVAARLIAEGVGAAAAEAAAAAARGDLRRARLLAGDEGLAARSRALAALPFRLDGTGARAAELAAELQAHLDRSQDALDARQAAELEALAERVERYGERGAGRAELQAAQRREVRRQRNAELRFAFAVLAGVYREALAGAPRAEAALGGIRRLEAATAALDRYPNESLLLQALFAGLPVLAQR